MRAHQYRLPLAIAAAAVAAGAATLLLRPRGPLIDPAAVEPAAYFSAAELERARDFRGPQRVIAFASLGLSAGALALLALWPPGPVRRVLNAAAARPILGAAAAGAGIAVTLTVVTLPLDALGHERAALVGLATQSWAPWLADVAKSTAVSAVMVAGGSALALALIRRFPRAWPAPAAVAVVVLATAFVYVSPVVLDPLFNRFEPLPAGSLRANVLELAGRAGVDVGEVYRVDASRRTTGANAYVGGLGPTKRVVLYDNLIERFPPEQVSSVVGHELAHVKNRDVPRGLLWLAIVAFPSMLVVQRLGERLARSKRAAPAFNAAGQATPAALPAFALALAVVSFAGGIAGNALSRSVEARADAFALDLTREPDAFIGLERSLAASNLAEPEPPALLHDLFGTHPTTIERIGYGVTWARER